METIQAVLHSKEIKRKALITALILVIIRFGCQLPLPGIDTEVLHSIMGNFTNGSFGFLDAITGSSFSSMSVFALNITVYITASIIVQLLTIAIPKLEELQKDGASGQEKIRKITRYITVGMALLESTAMAIGFGNQGLFGSTDAQGYAMKVILAILTLTAGSMIVVWLGDQISEYGIGNGISVILLVNILSTMPADYITLFRQFVLGAKSVGTSILGAAVIVLLTVAVIGFIVYLHEGERSIPVKTSRKYSAGAMQRNDSSIPLKVNMAGVMPIIFAASLLQFPLVIAQLVTSGTPEWVKYLTSSYWFRPGELKYSVGFLLYLVLILFFAYFYTYISFNPYNVANEMKKQGNFIPGIRPGEPTEKYIKEILKYLIFIGAAGLVLVAVIPMIVSGVWNASLSFAGTSLIIVVSVILEIADQLRATVRSQNHTLRKSIF